MKYILLVIVLFLLAGCSSIIARTGDDGQSGEPYLGFEYSVKNAKACNVAAILSFPPALIVSLPISVVDIVGSLLLDTVIAPIDLVMEKNRKIKRSVCHMDWSK